MANGSEFGDNQGMPERQAGTAGQEDQYFQPGMQVNKTYEIIGLIGHGTYGSVYRVRHLFLGKEMALKVLRADRVSENAWLRFQAEVAAVSRLNHPNIVRIFDLGLLERTLPFYAMELLQGHTLTTHLQKRKVLTYDEALPIFRQLAAGLAYVHEHQVIHRDINPSSIIICDPDASGQRVAKLIDFGVNKLAGGDGQTSSQEVDPSYMSPELCFGGTVDNRTDLYSLGVVMFETMTGVNPFRGSSPMITAQRHQALEAASMCEASDGVDFPPKLEALVASLLAKEPRARPRTAAEVVEIITELEEPMIEQSEALKEGQITTRVRKPYQSRKGDEDDKAGSSNGDKKPLVAVGIGIAVVALVGMLGAGGYYLYSTFGPKPTKEQLKAEAVKKADEERVRMDSLYKDELKKGPFFQGVVTQNGKQFNSFAFPDRFSMGDIELIGDEKGKYKVQGKVLIPAGPPLDFYPNEYCLAHSEVLKRFEEKDLQGITMLRDKNNVPSFLASPSSPSEGGSSDSSSSGGSTPTEGDRIIKNIQQIKGLTHLDIGGTGATDASFEVINRMPKLTNLNVVKTAIDGETLSEAPFLGQLESLEMGGNANAAKVLQALRYTTVIKNLGLDDCKLAGEDIIAIGTMKKLLNVRIADNHLEDADIEPLKEIPNLTNVTLVNCGLSPDCLKYISAFTNMKSLTISCESWTKEQKDKFNLDLLQSVPGVSLHFQESESGAESTSGSDSTSSKSE